MARDHAVALSRAFLLLALLIAPAGCGDGATGGPITLAFKHACPSAPDASDV